MLLYTQCIIHFHLLRRRVKMCNVEVPDTFQSLKDTEYLKIKNIDSLIQGNNSKYKSNFFICLSDFLAKDLMERMFYDERFR